MLKEASIAHHAFSWLQGKSAHYNHTTSGITSLREMKVVRTKIVSYKLAEKECTNTETNNNHK